MNDDEYTLGYFHAARPASGEGDRMTQDPGVLATLTAEFDAAEASVRRAEVRRLAAQSALGYYLAATGPAIVGGVRLVGLASPELGATVVRTPLASSGGRYDVPGDVVPVPAVVAGHAATDHVVLEDDGSPD